MTNISAKKTRSGIRGGNLIGKPHYTKSGKSAGGIEAVVTDAGNQPVELEGGEVIINKEASKRHWKELSRINQSAGDGVAIGPPSDPHDEDPSEYKTGGNVVEFNANKIPNKWILKYAENIKEKHPEIWSLGGNVFGNEAFKNLKRVANRGYWLDSEEWMMIKWRSYVAKHKKDYRIEGVVAMLKWVDKVDKGWPYMKEVIESEIQKSKNKKKLVGKKSKGGSLMSPKKGKTYQFSKTSGDLIVIEATDGYHQVDMIFDSVAEAKKFAKKYKFPTEKYADGGEILVVKTKKGLKTMKEFEDFSKDEIKEWGTERGWKYNVKGEKFGGQALKIDEFFVKPISKYKVKLPSSTYADGGEIANIVDNEQRVYPNKIRKLFSFVGDGVDELDIDYDANEVIITFYDNASGSISLSEWNKAKKILVNLEKKQVIESCVVILNTNTIILEFDEEFPVGDYEQGGQTHYFGASSEDEKKAGKATQSYYDRKSFTGQGWTGLYKNGNAFKSDLKKYYLPKLDVLLKNKSKKSVRILAMSKSRLVFNTTGEFSKAKVDKTFEKINENFGRWKQYALQISQFTTKEFVVELIDKLKQGGQTKAQKKKFATVMSEYKDGELHSGTKTGPIVKNKKQAVAIAHSVSKKYNTGGNVTNSGYTYRVRDTGRWNGNKVLDITISKITDSSVFFWDDTNAKDVRKKKADFNKLYVPEGIMLPSKTKRRTAGRKARTTPSKPSKSSKISFTDYQLLPSTDSETWDAEYKVADLVKLRVDIAKMLGMTFATDENIWEVLRVKITNKVTKSKTRAFKEKLYTIQRMFKDNKGYYLPVKPLSKNSRENQAGNVLTYFSPSRAVRTATSKPEPSARTTPSKPSKSSKFPFTDFQLLPSTDSETWQQVLEVGDYVKLRVNVADTVGMTFEDYENLWEVVGVNQRDSSRRNSSGKVYKIQRVAKDDKGYYLPVLPPSLMWDMGGYELAYLSPSRLPETATSKPEPPKKKEPRKPLPKIKREKYDKKLDYFQLFKIYLGEDAKEKTAQEIAVQTNLTYLATIESSKQTKVKTDSFQIGDIVRTIDLPEKVKAYLKPGQPMIANPWLDIEGVVVNWQEGDVRVEFDMGTSAFKEKNLILVKSKAKAKPKAVGKPKAKAKPKAVGKQKAKAKQKIYKVGDKIKDSTKKGIFTIQKVYKDKSYYSVRRDNFALKFSERELDDVLFENVIDVNEGTGWATKSKTKAK